MQTWQKWRDQVEREGMRFAPSPEYQVFPTRERPLKPYEAAVRAAKETQPLFRQLEPDVVVADIITVAASLTAQMEGRPWATIVPHVLPTHDAGFPPYSIGARLPRTRLGSMVWQAVRPATSAGERKGRQELNGARERVGLPPLDRLHGGISRQLAIVATFPQLEYPRHDWHPSVRVTGPLLWEQPYPALDPPPGDEPLVLVAPSTSQDPKQRMLRAALEGLAGEPVRVLASTNRRPPAEPLAVPPNAKLVDWLSYATEMPRCQAVVCHAGHGTVARALASGAPVVACPAAGDMAENAARVAWAGAGVSVPRRLATPRGIRLAVRRLLADDRYASTAAWLGEWAREHDGAKIAADAVEKLVSDS
jgi:UDP:flavonoid glycosyltransferase YjiC (YdhE family)